jgi:hypothetical protein
MATALAGRDDQSSTYSSALPQPDILPPTPWRHSAAICLVSQLDRELPVQTRALIINAFHHDISAADVYMAIDPMDEDLHCSWLLTILTGQFPHESFPGL